VAAAPFCILPNNTSLYENLGFLVRADFSFSFGFLPPPLLSDPCLVTPMMAQLIRVAQDDNLSDGKHTEFQGVFVFH
jgi:hypothetical protein